MLVLRTRTATPTSTASISAEETARSSRPLRGAPTTAAATRAPSTGTPSGTVHQGSSTGSPKREESFTGSSLPAGEDRREPPLRPLPRRQGEVEELLHALAGLHVLDHRAQPGGAVAPLDRPG